MPIPTEHDADSADGGNAGGTQAQKAKVQEQAAEGSPEDGEETLSERASASRDI